MILQKNQTYILVLLIIGIFRNIPLKNEIVRADGSKATVNAQISDISVSEDFKVSKEKGDQIIKIGNPNKEVNGDHSYTIKYKYNVGKDKLKGKDEFYYNLIGPEWAEEIKNVTFSITFPEDAKIEDYGVSSGVIGTQDTSNIYSNLDGNTLTGKTYKSLGGGEALTVRVTFPDNYFEGKSHVDSYPIIVIVISAICVLIADLLWEKFGKDREVIETVEFYPPEGYNSAEVGFLYKGNADDTDVVSLLIYLANKGYIKIDQNKRNFTITKVKDYDGDNKNEKLFLDKMFECGKGSVDKEKAREIVEEACELGEKILYQRLQNLRRIHQIRLLEVMIYIMNFSPQSIK